MPLPFPSIYLMIHPELFKCSGAIERCEDPLRVVVVERSSGISEPLTRDVTATLCGRGGVRPTRSCVRALLLLVTVISRVLREAPRHLRICLCFEHRSTADI